MNNSALYIGQSIVPEFRFWRDSRILDMTGASATVRITAPDATETDYALTLIDGAGGVMSTNGPITLNQVGVWKYWIFGSDANGGLISRPASSDYVFKH